MAGLALGIAITPLDTRIPEGLEDAMARAAQAGAGAVLIISDQRDDQPPRADRRCGFTAALRDYVCQEGLSHREG